MTITIHKAEFERLSEAELAPWRAARTPLLSDAMAAANTLSAELRPLDRGTAFVGQALTVRAIAADLLPGLQALKLARPGDVLVIDAGGHKDNAVLGGNMNSQARAKGIVGLVIDGAIRDVAEIRASGMPTFARAVTPAGPHKGGVGEVNGVISLGGVAVAPGDLICGDDDGVVVVPLARRAEILAEHDRIRSLERDWAKRLAAGEDFLAILGLEAEPS